MSETITARISLEALAALVSGQLESDGISAVLAGGAAVSIYSDTRYMSADLDFVSTERNLVIAESLDKLGFKARGKDFVHSKTPLVLEFPAGPLAFGDRYVSLRDTTKLRTPYGDIRIITPTQSVMDRVCWWIFDGDPQARAQALMVASSQEIDWGYLEAWWSAQEFDKSLYLAFKADVTGLA